MVTDPTVFEGSLDEVLDYFHSHLWTDGLPIVPPTRDRVERFLAHTDRRSDDVVATLLPGNNLATIASIAINGVMAGCRPEYMPVLIAAVEAISDPEFRLLDAGSTPSWEPVVIVSGPIARKLDLNFGAGVMKIGRQANSTIGRFVRLYMRNVAGFLTPPGDTDKGTIGMNFMVAVAEDEAFVEQIGWPTFGQDQGFEAGDSVVTVQGVVAPSMPTYTAGDHAESHAELLAEIIGQNLWAYWAWTGLWYGKYNPLLVLGPAVAQVFAQDGWSKDDLRRYFVANTSLKASKYDKYPWHGGITGFSLRALVQQGRLPAGWSDSDDPDRLLPILTDPHDIGIVVAGDPARNQSKGFAPCHEQGPRVSKRVADDPAAR